MQDVLFSLYGFDTSDGGLHHGTACLACAIITGNAWDGYLSESRDGPRLDLGLDDVLTGQDYWFHIPAALTSGSSPSLLAPNSHITPYAVAPTFQDWQFPHSSMPQQWVHPSSQRITAPGAASNLTATVQVRDQSCRITQCRDRTEAAHLCPRAEREWFKTNGMDVYNTNDRLPENAITDDGSNALLLRSDLHSDMDDCKFVFVPKCKNWVVHTLTVTNELGRLYHNVASHDISGVSPAFLLTRFAWAIFPLLRGFLAKGVRRHLIRAKSVEGNIRWVTEMVDGEESRDLAGIPSRSRSVSPTKGNKRPREEESGAADSGTSGSQDSRLNTSRKRKREGSRGNAASRVLSGPVTSLELVSPEHMSGSDLEQREMAEDIARIKIVWPGMPHGIDQEVENSTDYMWQSISIYPGHRRVKRLKDEWLKNQRPEEDEKKPTWEGDEEWGRGPGWSLENPTVDEIDDWGYSLDNIRVEVH
jgi:hypothetical protein